MTGETMIALRMPGCQTVWRICSDPDIPTRANLRAFALGRTPASRFTSLKKVQK